MKKLLLFIIFCTLLPLSACSPPTEPDTLPRLPWPTHAPEATPYISQPKENEPDPNANAEVYDSWEDLLASMYMQVNNFYFKDWELEMFKALPQDKSCSFTVHDATITGVDNEAVLATAKEFDALGVKAQVWAIEDAFEGEVEIYYVCFVECTPAELWALSDKTEHLYYIEQKYASVALRAEIKVWPEGDEANG